MPPRKRKAPATKATTAKKTKKTKKQEEEEVQDDTAGACTTQDIIHQLKAADKGKMKSHAPDKYCSLLNAQVHEDYDCMLNQTNIGHNNNKYYVIQVLSQGGAYYAWNRWGRVGEPGQNSFRRFTDVDKAIADFEKKFKDKTKNEWSKRSAFEPQAGKYTLIEIDAGNDEEVEVSTPVASSGPPVKTEVSTLSKPLQEFMKLIFDNDMFKEALQKFEIDVKKMPLGKLSKTQIAKGFEVLEAIDQALDGDEGHTKIQELSSRFYTVIPHDFGRQRPPSIGDRETLQKKYDMLAVLGDIEIAQRLQEGSAPASKEKQANPLDVHYLKLCCKMEHIDPKSDEFKMLDKYARETAGRTFKLLEAFRVDRQEEQTRFKSHAAIKHRKLLWHGTNVAVVAAILRTGLRIMPHSGGRVGRGIYFASECGKSMGYVQCTSQRIGCMFLNEVALGREHHITRDDGSLTVAPEGYDSIVAKGWNEPDPAKDLVFKVEGNDILVPQGKPIAQPKFKGSSFNQSEYLIYKESQNRMRYVLKMQF